MEIRDYLAAEFRRLDAAHRVAAGVTLPFIKNEWTRKLEAIEAGEPLGVHWSLVARFLSREQIALGGRWIVQEDGSLLKDLE